MGRAPGSKADECYLGDAWAWAGEVGSTHNCGLRVVLVPTGRRGVWVVRLEAVEVVDGRATSVRAVVKAEYPDASPVTLAGRLYALSVKLDRELTLQAQARAEGVL